MSIAKDSLLYFVIGAVAAFIVLFAVAIYFDSDSCDDTEAAVAGDVMKVAATIRKRANTHGDDDSAASLAEQTVDIDTVVASSADGKTSHKSNEDGDIESGEHSCT